MRTFFVYSVLALLVTFVLVVSNVVDSLFVFLLSGSIPGTSIALSPTGMMALLAAVAWLLLTYLTSVGTTQLRWAHRLIKRQSKRDERMPKRRYSRI